MVESTKSSLAALVWRRLFTFIIETRAHRDRALERYQLTRNDSRALFTLDEREGRTMRSLAKAWACDPSNATWVVDRLERAGYAERRAQAGDRRVKLVALTRQGARTKAALERELYQPPEELLALGRVDLQRLAAATERLSARPQRG